MAYLEEGRGCLKLLAGVLQPALDTFAMQYSVEHRACSKDLENLCEILQRPREAGRSVTCLRSGTINVRR